METQPETDSDGTNNNSNLKLEPQSEPVDDEGVWSEDIEAAFHESLQIYPPCGRRKIILSEEGKMYGRNEMIARYILLKTGKKRTRKQVSSHIQVLHRRTQREKQPLQKHENLPKHESLQKHNNPMELINAMQTNLYKVVNNHPALPRPEPMEKNSQNIIGSERFGLREFEVSVQQTTYDKMDERDPQGPRHSFLSIHPSQTSYTDDEWVNIKEIYDKFPRTEENEIGLRQLFEAGPTDSFFLIKFWADSDFHPDDTLHQKYELFSAFESASIRQIEITTIVYSFSKQAVKKIEIANPQISHQSNGKTIYQVNSDLCDYGKGFIERLLSLSPDKMKMDLVLENFTVLYKVKDHKTNETLLVLALVFEVSKNTQGSTYNIYKLRS